jgi:alpha-N-arabinofuranosidase
VLSLANLAQIVNVLHAPVMTEGGQMWLTPTYHALQLHTPHLGAEALPVDVTRGNSIPGGENLSAVTGTASRTAQGQTVTITNRHFDQASSVTLVAPSTTRVVRAQILSSATAYDVNSAQDPRRVALSDLAVQADGSGQWRVEMPAHSVATIQFS